MLIDDAGADADDDSDADDYNEEDDNDDNHICWFYPVWLQIARKFCGK